MPHAKCLAQLPQARKGRLPESTGPKAKGGVARWWRNPFRTESLVSDSIPLYQQAMVSTMVSKWCEMDLVHAQGGLEFKARIKLCGAMAATWPWFPFEAPPKKHTLEAVTRKD